MFALQHRIVPAICAIGLAGLSAGSAAAGEITGSGKPNEGDACRGGSNPFREH